MAGTTSHVALPCRQKQWLIIEECMGMGIPIPMAFPWEMGVVLGYYCEWEWE